MIGASEMSTRSIQASGHSRSNVTGEVRPAGKQAVSQPNSGIRVLSEPHRMDSCSSISGAADAVLQPATYISADVRLRGEQIALCAPPSVDVALHFLSSAAGLSPDAPICPSLHDRCDAGALQRVASEPEPHPAE